MQQWEPNGRIAELLGALAVEAGYTPSLLDAVRFVRVNGAKRANRSSSRASSSSGKDASAFLGDQAACSDPNNYLWCCRVLPLECGWKSLAGQALLGLCRVDPVALGELLMEMEDNYLSTGDGAGALFDAADGRPRLRRGAPARMLPRRWTAHPRTASCGRSYVLRGEQRRGAACRGRGTAASSRSPGCCGACIRNTTRSLIVDRCARRHERPASTTASRP